MSERQCPWNRKLDCRDCKLERRGVKITENTGESIPYEACVFDIIADNVEMTHRRMIALQAELGQVKQIALLSALVSMGDDTARNELLRITQREVQAQPNLKQVVNNAPNNKESNTPAKTE